MLTKRIENKLISLSRTLYVLNGIKFVDTPKSSQIKLYQAQSNPNNHKGKIKLNQAENNPNNHKGETLRCDLLKDIVEHVLSLFSNLFVK